MVAAVVLAACSFINSEAKVSAQAKASSQAKVKAQVSVQTLTAEMAQEPLGIECAQPRFRWKIASDVNDCRQTAYQIEVYKRNGDKPVWKSGWVKSDKSVYVPYEGTKLEPMTRYAWRVNVRTNRGETGFSNEAEFGVGIPGGETHWGAEWVGGQMPGDDSRVAVPARYLRKEFSTDSDKDIAYATLFVSGLGTYFCEINGHKTREAELQGAPTKYDKSVRYDAHDVTDLLKQGSNTIGVALGNGRFCPERIPNMHWFGYPRMLARLEIVYSDGSRQTVVSDDSWKITTDGPIRANSEFFGETYDARMEMDGWSCNGFDDSKWVKAPLAGTPLTGTPLTGTLGGRLEYQLNPPIRKMDYVLSKSVTELEPGRYIVDFGQNMTGWAQCKFRYGAEGDSIRIRFAETLNPDGSLYTANLRGARPEDIYIMKGVGEEIWEPTFTYHGFRYAEVTGLSYKPSPTEFLGVVIYDGLPDTGTFTTSDTTINQVYKNAHWGIRGNYRGMPTDCPQRDERLGWLGDRTTGAYGESFPFGNHLLYAKWLDDIESTQRPSGGIPDIAPNYWDCYNDDTTWPAAYFTVADMLHKRFGDSQPIRKHYPSMKRWLEYMNRTYVSDGIIERDEYGDWCLPPETPEIIFSSAPDRITDGALLATSHFYYITTLMADFARVAGEEADALKYEKDAEIIKNAFNARFLDREKGYYSNGTVTANLLPLRFGLAPEDMKESVVNQIVEKTEKEFDGHISVGVMGVQHIMRGLTELGRLDLAVKLATNRDYPSWGYMADNGATTIWELWNGNTAAPEMNSGNHVMLLGDMLIWEYEYLAGIGNAPGSAGYKQILLKPHIPANLDNVSATFESIYGPVVSSWRKENGQVIYDFEVPANTTALVSLPRPDGTFAVPVAYPSGRHRLTFPY